MNIGTGFRALKSLGSIARTSEGRNRLKALKNADFSSGGATALQGDAAKAAAFDRAMGNAPKDVVDLTKKPKP